MERSEKAFKEFIDLCREVTSNDTVVMELLQKRYNGTNPHFLWSKDFPDLVNRCSEKIRSDRANKYVYIRDFTTELKAYKAKPLKHLRDTKREGGATVRKVEMSAELEPPAKRLKISPSGSENLPKPKENSSESTSWATKTAVGEIKMASCTLIPLSMMCDENKSHSSSPQQMEKEPLTSETDKGQSKSNIQSAIKVSEASKLHLPELQVVLEKINLNDSSFDRQNFIEMSSDDEMNSHSTTTEKSVESAENSGKQCIETRDGHLQRNIKKLEALLKKLNDEIQKLQQVELSLQDMDKEDSTYTLEDRYKKRFVKVWNRLCQLKGRDTTTGRETDRSLNYGGTSYLKINRTISRFINKFRIFPDYSDIHEIIVRCNKKHNLGIKKSAIDQLAREAFTDVGNILQKRRMVDHVNNFGSHLTEKFRSRDDPALFDSSLRQKLEENQRISKSKLDEVINKYTQKQIDGDEEDEEEEEEDEEDEEDGEEDFMTDMEKLETVIFMNDNTEEDEATDDNSKDEDEDKEEEEEEEEKLENKSPLDEEENLGGTPHLKDKADHNEVATKGKGLVMEEETTASSGTLCLSGDSLDQDASPFVPSETEPQDATTTDALSTPATKSKQCFDSDNDLQLMLPRADSTSEAVVPASSSEPLISISEFPDVSVSDMSESVKVASGQSESDVKNMTSGDVICLDDDSVRNDDSCCLPNSAVTSQDSSCLAIPDAAMNGANLVVSKLLQQPPNLTLGAVKLKAPSHNALQKFFGTNSSTTGAGPKELNTVMPLSDDDDDDVVEIQSFSPQTGFGRVEVSQSHTSGSTFRQNYSRTKEESCVMTTFEERVVSTIVTETSRVQGSSSAAAIVQMKQQTTKTQRVVGQIIRFNHLSHPRSMPQSRASLNNRSYQMPTNNLKPHTTSHPVQNNQQGCLNQMDRPNSRLNHVGQQSRIGQTGQGRSFCEVPLAKELDAISSQIASSIFKNHPKKPSDPEVIVCDNSSKARTERSATSDRTSNSFQPNRQTLTDLGKKEQRGGKQDAVTSVACSRMKKPLLLPRNTTTSFHQPLKQKNLMPETEVIELD